MVYFTSSQAQVNNMKQETYRKIDLDSFNNIMGLEMGLCIVNLAKERDQNIAVQIDR